jgi:hypothetical protein
MDCWLNLTIDPSAEDLVFRVTRARRPLTVPREPEGCEIEPNPQFRPRAENVLHPMTR